MIKRTSIELDEELLARAKRALGAKTTRGTVEEALRRATDQAELVAAERAEAQTRYLDELPRSADLAILASEEMWR